jgi:acetyltransferase-like isoleucine patch superfamily enzyme
VSQLATFSAINIFKESPFLVWYYNLMGSKVGDNVFIGSFFSREFDLIELGDRVSINLDATMKCSIIEDRVLRLRKVVIGNDVTLGIRAIVLAGSQIEMGAEIDDYTLVPEFTRVSAGVKMAGSPAKNVGLASEVPVARAPKDSLFGIHTPLLQLLSIAVVKLMNVCVYIPVIYVMVICINNSPEFDPAYSVYEAVLRELGQSELHLPQYSCTGSTVYADVYEFDTELSASSKAGPACVFPFSYNDVMYTSCTVDDPPDSSGTQQLEQSEKQIVLPWCGVSSAVSSRTTTSSGKGGKGGRNTWGVCECTFEGFDNIGDLSGLTYMVIFQISLLSYGIYPFLWLLLSLPVRCALLGGSLRKASTFPVSDVRFARIWCAKLIYDECQGILKPLQGTMVLPFLFRCFGARIGRNVEISSSEGIEPHHMQLEEGSFVADSVIVAAGKVHGMSVSHGDVLCRARSFVGNGSVVPHGTVLAEDSLVALQSIAPLASTPGSSFMGSRAIEIKRSEVAVTDVPDHLTYNPTSARKLCRFLIELTGFTYLNFCQAGMFTTAIICLEELFETVGVAGTILLLPLVHIGIAFGGCLVTLLTKWVLIGRFRKGHFPLWTSYVWRTEFVERIEVNLAEPSLIQYLGGTNFMAVWFRLLGAKIGARPYIEQAILTEPDLIRIGDYCTLEKSATIQAHLFQDRIRTCDHVRLGDGCSVGKDAVVLLGAELKDGAALSSLSLVMRHESLPPNSKWHGSPAEPDYSYKLRSQAGIGEDFSMRSDRVQELVASTITKEPPGSAPLVMVEEGSLSKNTEASAPPALKHAGLGGSARIVPFAQ